MFEKTKNYLRVAPVKTISLYGDSYRCGHFYSKIKHCQGKHRGYLSDTSAA